MTPSDKAVYQSFLEKVSLAQRLSLKAMAAPNRQALIFIILNDTYHIFPYDRAVLWRLTKGTAELLGVSGQATFTTDSELVDHWKTLLKSLTDRKKTKELTAEEFPNQLKDWEAVKPLNASMKVMWVPFHNQEDEVVGLWFERWGEPEKTKSMPEEAKLLDAYLMPGYEASWKQHALPIWWKKLRDRFNRKHLSFALLALFCLLFLVRVPLRITAPCEVVGKDPFVITAPLDGLIESIAVKPGQPIKKNDVLYNYDKRIPLHELEVAEKEVEILQADANRLMVSGVQDPRSLPELTVAEIKLQKGLADLNYAKYRISQLTGTSPADGIVIIEKPEEWRGRPVKVGEKIMEISNPDETKVRIWIPESDNIVFNRSIPVKIFLNPNPTNSLEAKLVYISPVIMNTELHIPSFMAEAEWIGNPKEVGLGVKGTAILYGERVTLFYYILRKPISTLRRWAGV